MSPLVEAADLAGSHFSTKQTEGLRKMDLRRRCAVHESGHATAALAFGIPLVSVSIADGNPHVRRACYRAPHDCGLECLVTLCLAGPEAEKQFCGPISDDSDRVDYQMAYEYLARQLNPLQIGGELVRLRDAAQRLVRSASARQRICLLADALSRHGTLSKMRFSNC
jgi:hypothetical protein